MRELRQKEQDECNDQFQILDRKLLEFSTLKEMLTTMNENLNNQRETNNSALARERSTEESKTETSNWPRPTNFTSNLTATFHPKLPTI